MSTSTKPINRAELPPKSKKSDTANVGPCKNIKRRIYVPRSILNPLRKVHTLKPLFDQLADEQARLSLGLEHGWWGTVTSSLKCCTKIEARIIHRAAALGLLQGGRV